MENPNLKWMIWGVTRFLDTSIFFLKIERHMRGPKLPDVPPGPPKVASETTTEGAHIVMWKGNLDDEKRGLLRGSFSYFRAILDRF